MEDIAVATRDLLRWVATHRATYDEAFAAWQTSCPRSSVWEDAFIEGLVAVERATTDDEGAVVLTTLGRETLDAAS